MNISAVSIRRLAAVCSVLALGTVAWNSATAAEPQGSAIHVRLADLDLATAGGRQAAYDRLHAAARTVCFRVSQPEDVGRDIHIAACVDRVMAQMDVTLRTPSKSDALQAAATPSR
jgi:UrcA family protein